MYYYKGFNENICTFAISGNIIAGQPVVICDNCTVRAAADGEDFCGIVSNTRNGAASVQLTGYVELPYSGEAPAVGKATFVADGNGGVKVGTSGSQLLVVAVDTASAKVGVIL